MTSEDLKKKPRYPETIFGTNCMGENWTICCPNRHLKYDRYSQTKQVIQIKYRGGIYRVFFCTNKCAKIIKNLAYTRPDDFKKLFIKSFKPNGDMVIKHRDTNVPCQVAIKIDTYSDSGNKTAKQKGGSGRAMTRRNKKCSRSMSMSKSRFSKSRRNKTMRR
jgi:hypothetical protein